ncbi:peptidase M19 [Rhodothalassium salexigens]|uniref:dipeptidase n=1 Tax=Rhodothalassium salexigens TaxID=1086 RepID=UPI0019136B30|nr:dipeptidase [Rhodothalassium salexigens]MBK5910761.1 peptidase M19 [Rhodothalassium salexigens]MBK5919789.1 peptidase M19 [Rhodothalassium salexigens]
MTRSLLAAALCGLALPALLPTAAHAQADRASDRARALAQTAIIVDGHVDMPYRVQVSGADVGEAVPAHDFDFPRAKAGGLDAPFMSIYVGAAFQGTGGARAEADRLIGLVEGQAALHPDKFEIAYSAQDVVRIKKAGKIALPLGMENGAPIEGDLANLAHFHKRGIRYVTLAHSRVNHLSDSSYDEERRWGGLSPFGRLAVAEMNRLGIMVDVSHITDAAFDDVMAVTRAPVIASHSSCRHFTPGFERNMSDAMIERLGENGGLIMINFGSSFLTAEANGHRRAMAAAYDAYLADNDLTHSAEREAAFEAGYQLNKPYPHADVGDVADHIDRAVELAGIDHVGLGSDFDGVGDTLPEGLKSPADLPNLIDELIDRGYSDGDIVKILSGNLLRVWRAVEAAAE